MKRNNRFAGDELIATGCETRTAVEDKGPERRVAVMVKIPCSSAPPWNPTDGGRDEANSFFFFVYFVILSHKLMPISPENLSKV